MPVFQTSTPRRNGNLVAEVNSMTAFVNLCKANGLSVSRDYSSETGNKFQIESAQKHSGYLIVVSGGEIESVYPIGIGEIMAQPKETAFSIVSGGVSFNMHLATCDEQGNLRNTPTRVTMTNPPKFEFKLTIDKNIVDTIRGRTFLSQAKGHRLGDSKGEFVEWPKDMGYTITAHSPESMTQQVANIMFSYAQHINEMRARYSKKILYRFNAKINENHKSLWNSIPMGTTTMVGFDWMVVEAPEGYVHGVRNGGRGLRCPSTRTFYEEGRGSEIYGYGENPYKMVDHDDATEAMFLDVVGRMMTIAKLFESMQESDTDVLIKGLSSNILAIGG